MKKLLYSIAILSTTLSASNEYSTQTDLPFGVTQTALNCIESKRAAFTGCTKAKYFETSHYKRICDIIRNPLDNQRNERRAELVTAINAAIACVSPICQTSCRV